MEAHLERAEQLAGSCVIRQRVKLVRQSFDYCKLVVSYLRKVDAAVKQNNSGELTAEQLKTFERKAEFLNAYVDEHHKSGAIAGRNIYTKALTDPEQVAKELSRRPEPLR
jgi:hypothetical protein